MPAKNASAMRWPSSLRRASSRSSSWSKATTTGIFEAAQDLHQHLEQGQHEVLPASAGPGTPARRSRRSGSWPGRPRRRAGRPGRSPGRCGGASGRRCCAPRSARRAGTPARRRARRRAPASSAAPDATAPACDRRRWTALSVSISHCVRSWACDAAEAEPPRPAAQARRREQVEPLRPASVRVRALPSSRRTSCSPTYSSGRTPFCLPPPSSVSMIWNSRYSRKSRVLLVGAGRDEQLPGAVGAVLDRVQQVRLARPLVAEDRHHLGVRRRVVAVQIDDAEQLVALARRTVRGRGSGRRPRRRGCGRSSCGTDCRPGAAPPGPAPSADVRRRRWSWELLREPFSREHLRAPGQRSQMLAAKRNTDQVRMLA